MSLETRNVRPEQAEHYYPRDDFSSVDTLHHSSQWLGQGASHLGLKGPIEVESLKQLLHGYSPSGDLLISRKPTIQGHRERAALDCVFSPCKSVSLLVHVHGDQKLLRAHHRAAKQTLQLLEQRYAQTRVRNRGERRIVPTQFLVIGTIDHAMSRALNPHHHTHSLVFNLTRLPSGKWYSLHNDAIHDHKKLLGMVYQHQLALETRKIGYEIERRPHGQFEILGFTREQLMGFSARRQQILRHIDGDSSWAQRQWAAENTKARKGDPLSQMELMSYWQSQANDLGISFPKPNPLSQPSESNARQQLEIAINQAIQDLSQPVELEVFEQQLLEHGPIVGFDQIQQAISDSPELIIADNRIGVAQRWHLGHDLGKPQGTLETTRLLLNQHQIHEAVEHLDQVGRIVENRDPETFLGQLVQDYLALNYDEQVPTHIQVNSATARAELIDQIRSGLKSSGGLGHEELTITQLVPKDLSAEQLGFTHNFDVGDVIIPEHDSQRRGIEGGKLYGVTEKDQDTLTIQPFATTDPSALKISPWQVTPKFKMTAYTPRSIPVAEWERLVWTRGNRPLGQRRGQEFGILHLDGHMAQVQYRNGRYQQVDLSVPLHLEYAIAHPLAPKQRVRRILIAGDESLSLPQLKQALDQAQFELKIYTPSKAQLLQQLLLPSAEQSVLDTLRQQLREQVASEALVGATTLSERAHAQITNDYSRSDLSTDRVRPDSNPVQQTRGQSSHFSERLRALTDRLSGAINRSVERQGIQRITEAVAEFNRVLANRQQTASGAARFRAAIIGLNGTCTNVIDHQRVRPISRGLMTQQVISALESAPMIQALKEFNSRIAEMQPEQKFLALSRFNLAMDGFSRNHSQREQLKRDSLLDVTLSSSNSYRSSNERTTNEQRTTTDGRTIRDEPSRGHNPTRVRPDLSATEQAGSLSRGFADKLAELADAISRGIGRTAELQGLQRITRPVEDLNRVLADRQQSASGAARFRAAIIGLNGAITDTTYRYRARRVGEGLIAHQIVSGLGAPPMIQALREVNAQLSGMKLERKSIVMNGLQEGLASYGLELSQRQTLEIAQTAKSLFTNLGVGERQSDQSLLFASNNFVYRMDGDLVSITAKDGRGEVLRVAGNTVVVNALSKADLENCHRLKQRVAEGVLVRSQCQSKAKAQHQPKQTPRLYRRGPRL